MAEALSQQVERGGLSGALRDRIVTIFPPVILLVLWEALARTGLLDNLFFPAPSSVVGDLWSMLATAHSRSIRAPTLGRVGAGLLIGTVLGVGLCLVLGLVRTFRLAMIPILAVMRSLPQPIVVRIQGYAYGAGFNLALAADFRVIARDAKLATPFITRGMATGTNLLQQYVGIGKAIELTLLGEPVDALEALKLGLVNEVVDADQLDDAVERWSGRLADGPTASMALTKHAVYQAWNLDPDGAYWQQGSAVAESQKLEDLAEGIAAFKDKRAPRFTGR